MSPHRLRFQIISLHVQGGIRAFFASITSNKMVRTTHFSATNNFEFGSTPSITTLSFLVNGEKNLRTPTWGSMFYLLGYLRSLSHPQTAQWSPRATGLLELEFLFMDVVFSCWNCVVLVGKSKKHTLHEKMDLLIFANKQICIKYDIY